MPLRRSGRWTASATFAAVSVISRKRLKAQLKKRITLRKADVPATWDRLQSQIIKCRQCPRLVAHCRQKAAEKRASFRDETYWGKPVPNFGPATARLLIVGLAPAAHGGNRTGRVFTGDRSGDFLFRALYETGFANQPTSRDRDDGLEMIDAAITAVAHCAPPDNKPLPEELAKCSTFLTNTFDLLPN